MTLDVPVELLERALGYTRVALSEVRAGDARRPTPCLRWRLVDLLDHMDDTLDAFLEAAGGTVRDHPSPHGSRDVTDLTQRLQGKACDLLGLWTAGGSATISVGTAVLDRRLLLGTAALEITVHGWDVATTLGSDHPVPDALGRALLPVAHVVVDPSERGVRFGPRVAAAADADAGRQLLGFLGRDSAGPPRRIAV